MCVERRFWKKIDLPHYSTVNSIFHFPGNKTSWMMDQLSKEANKGIIDSNNANESCWNYYNNERTHSMSCWPSKLLRMFHFRKICLIASHKNNVKAVGSLKRPIDFHCAVWLLKRQREVGMAERGSMDRVWITWVSVRPQVLTKN